MPSKQFKDLVASIKKLGPSYDLPYNILFDKVTGEPKPSPKNLQAYELIKLFDELPNDEKVALTNIRQNPLADQLVQYASTILDKRTLVLISYTIGSRWRDVQRKLKDIEAKREREKKKAAIASAKQKLVMSLNRKDVKDTIDAITNSIEPYIKKAEGEIKQSLTEQNKKFQKDWNDTVKRIEQTDVEFWGHRGSSSQIEAHSEISYGRVKVNGEVIKFSNYVYQEGLPIRAWIDHNKRMPQLTNSAIWFSKGKVGDLIQQTQKMFRQSQINKVSTLFYRLFQSNPTLKNYRLDTPYNGKEFTMSAENDKGERVIIQTNTIMAGGYNIQRLHSRWLINVRNTITGKAEKFTITDKDIK